MVKRATKKSAAESLAPVSTLTAEMIEPEQLGTWRTFEERGGLKLPESVTTYEQNGVLVAEGLDNELYHADRTHESSSTIKAFLADPELYYQQRVLRAIPSKKSSNSMNLGTAVHCLLLEPENYERLVAVCEPGVSDRMKRFDEFLSELPPGVTGITYEDSQKVPRMVESVLADPAARELLESPGLRELSAYWTDSATGVRCKVRFDRLLDDGRIFDLKTTKDPYPLSFAKDAGDYGYHLSAAFYCLGRNRLMGKVNAMHQLVTVGKEPPFTTIVYTFGDRSLKHAHSEVRSALDDMTALRDMFGEQQQWRSRYFGKINTLDVPGWRLNGSY